MDINPDYAFYLRSIIFIIIDIYFCRATYLDILRRRLVHRNFPPDPPNLFIRQMYFSPYGEETFVYRNGGRAFQFVRIAFCQHAFLFNRIFWEVKFLSVTFINNLNSKNENILSRFWNFVVVVVVVVWNSITVSA